MEKDKWNSFAGDFQRVYRMGLHDYDTGLLNFLQRSACTGPGCRVLDIGCGVGKYAVCLARAGCDVTLLDSAKEMLAPAAENLTAAGIPADRWRTVCCDFHQVSGSEALWQNGFDLSICTMSPAVCDPDTVQTMSRMTHGLCFVAKFHDSRQLCREELLQGLVPAPRALFTRHMRESCAAVTEAVREAGYGPQCRTVPYTWSDRRTPAEFADYVYRHYLADMDPDGTLREAVFSRAAALHADTLEDRVETQVQWIFWTTV